MKKIIQFIYIGLILSVLVACGADGKSYTASELHEPLFNKTFVKSVPAALLDIDTVNYDGLLIHQKYITFEKEGFGEATMLISDHDGAYYTYEEFDDNDEFGNHYEESLISYDEFFHVIKNTPYMIKRTDFKSEDSDLDPGDSIYWISDDKFHSTTVGFLLLSNDVYDENFSYKNVSKILKKVPTKDLEEKLFDVMSDYVFLLDDLTYDEIVMSLKNMDRKKTSYSLGDTIDFDGIDVTLNNIDSWDTVDNRFSDINGEAVFMLNITTKNNTDEIDRLNMFSYKIFAPDGTKTEAPHSYFKDTLFDKGEMLPGASVTANLPILYKGDGEYTFVLDNYASKTLIKFQVEK